MIKVFNYFRSVNRASASCLVHNIKQVCTRQILRDYGLYSPSLLIQVVYR